MPQQTIETAPYNQIDSVHRTVRFSSAQYDGILLVVGPGGSVADFIREAIVYQVALRLEQRRKARETDD